MRNPARTTNHRGVKITRRLVVKHTVDKPVIEIANLLAKSIAGFIDAQAAALHSAIAPDPTYYCVRCLQPFKVIDPVELNKTKAECGRCWAKSVMRARIFQQIAPQVRTVGGMAPIGNQYVEVEGEEDSQHR